MADKTSHRISISGCRMYSVILAILLSFTTTRSQHVSNSNATNSPEVLQAQPIVIQTQARDYEQPTLIEYQMCHSNRDKCVQVCSTAANRTACEAECPSCPILITQDVVVQGINDTNYSGTPTSGTSAVNTTNIIRLTNEIHNIVEHSSGNVTTHNENNIHLYENHRNISTSGGKFGLGYNQNGSCCIVVRAARSCERHRFATAARCHRKRHRVCGERCTARVLYAQRVTKCEKQQGGNEKCHEAVTYVPYDRRGSAASPRNRRHSNCHYTQQWPFVACPGSTVRQTADGCQRCYQLPYIDVMQQRVPPSCWHCYGSLWGAYNLMPPLMPLYGAAWPNYASPMVVSPHNPSPDDEGFEDFDYRDENFLRADGWQLDTSSGNTAGGRGGSDSEVGSHIANTEFPDDGYYDYFDQDDGYDFGDVETVRRRRHSPRGFRRSKYSRRHRGRF